jgi:hypothetical protein
MIQRKDKVNRKKEHGQVGIRKEGSLMVVWVDIYRGG